MSLLSRLGSRFRAEFLGSVVATGVGALLVFVLARLLDPDGYGLLFLAISVISVVRIFSTLGIAKSAARYVAEYRERDPGQVPHVLDRSLLLNLATILIVSVAFLLANRPIVGLIGEPGLGPFLLLGTLYVVTGSLAVYARRIAQAFEEIELAATLTVIENGCRLVFGIGVVLLGFDALWVLGAFVLGAGLASATGFTVLYARHYRGAPRADRMEPGLFRRIVEYNVPLTVTGMTGKIDKDVDTILVGFFINPVAVGYYVLSKQIVQALGMPVRALGFSISPVYGKQKAAKRLDTAARVFETSFSYTLLLYVPAAAGVFFVASPAVELVFGTDYAGAVPVLQVLSAYLVLGAITKITDEPLDYLGRARERAIAKSIAASGNVALNVLLIPWIGVVGAAIATVITHSFYVSVKLWVVYTELPVRTYRMAKELAVVLAITVAMSLVVTAALPYVNGLLSLFLVVLLGAATWSALSLVSGVVDVGTVRRAIS